MNSDISSTCAHSMVNFGPLTAEIGWRLRGTPADFNGFCVLASLLHRRGSAEVIQTLHDVWPSPGLVHYIYICGGCCPLMKFCQVQNSLCVKVLRSPISAALLHGTRETTSGKLCGVVSSYDKAAIPFDLWMVELSSYVI